MTPRRSAFAAGLFAALLLGAAAGSAEAVTIATVNQTVPTSGTQQQTGRLFRDTTASTCAQPKTTAPDIFDASMPSLYRYRNHTFASSLTHPVCVTVNLTTACTGSNEIFSAAYIGDFVVETLDPANPRTRYAGDMGDSPPRKTSYSFMAPPEGALIGLVVHEVSSGAGCNAYTISWSSDGPWADDTPSIGGTPTPGTVLTGTDASWKATPAVERRWRRCDVVGANCTDIPGANGATYTVSDADLGHTLRFRNDATDADATNTSDSPVVEPFIPFDTRAGQSLGPGDRVHGGFFARSGFESRCGATNAAPVVLQPANNFTYDPFPVASLLNESVCLVARTTQGCSSGVSPAIYNPAFAPSAGIQTNYAGHSGNGLGLPGVVSVPLPPAESREVVVSRIGTTAPCGSYSLTLGVNAAFATARPSVGGSPVEGNPLRASDGTWSGSPAFSYGWLRCDATGAACVPIDGATFPTHTPTADDVGRRLRVRVTATQGRSVSSDSEPTGVVAAGPVEPPPPADRGSTLPAFGAQTLVTLALAAKRIPANGPLAIRVSNSNQFDVSGRLSGETSQRLSPARRKRRIKLKAKAFLVSANTRKTVKLRLPKALRRRLARKGRLSLRLTARVRDPAGTARTVRRTLSPRLKRRRAG